MVSIFKRNQRFISAIYLASVTITLYWAFSHFAYDDPFITYRYAENLRRGLGFVYNPGERVLSTTTPLFALLLALLGNIWPDLPQLANLISAFSLAVGGLLMWDLGQSWKTALVSWTGLLLFPTFSLLIITLGSETSLYLALCLAAIALYARQRLGGAVILASLAILTRSDGILLAFILASDYLWVNRKQLGVWSFWRGLPWISIAIATGLLLIWHSFAWAYFGSPLPVTLASKQAQGLMSISQKFAPGLMKIAGWYAPYWQYWVQLGVVIIGLVGVVFVERRWFIMIAWAVLYFLAYTLLGVTSYYWYYAPLVPGWVVAIGLGLTLISRLPLWGALRRSSWGTCVRYGLVVIFLLVFLAAQVSNLDRIRKTPDARAEIYRAVGTWLSENIPPDASVGALEVGIIGYYAQRPMVDFAGLIQPEIAQQFQGDTTYENAAFWCVQQFSPAYLVLLSGLFPVFEQEYVAQSCNPVQCFSGKDYGFLVDLVIYDCQS
jgi:hypothetical protein